MTRDEAIQALNEIFDDSEFSRYESWYGTAMNMAIEALKAEPVKHGEWEQHDGCVLCKDDDTYFYTCSCCKMAITEAERGLFNYCPNCGCAMTKEKEK